MRRAAFGQLILLTTLAGAGLTEPAEGQSVPRPHPSSLWSRTATVLGASDTLRQQVPSSKDKERGLLVGGLIGGVGAGILGNRVCHAYSATGDCTGQTLWWATLGGLLGGLIGATARD